MQTMDALAFERALIAYARAFPLRKGKLRVMDRLWRVAAGDRGTARLAHLRYGGLKMPCDLTEMLQRQFYFFGTYFLEEQILDCWTKAAKEAEVIFDVSSAFIVWGRFPASQTPSSMPSSRRRRSQADCGRPRSLIISTTSWSMRSR
jgi:hypothetical protein